MRQVFQAADIRDDVNVISGSCCVYAYWFNPSIAHQALRSSEAIFRLAAQNVKTIPRQCDTDRVFYPRTAAEVLALDVLHDAGGQHVTRADVEHRLDRQSPAGCGHVTWTASPPTAVPEVLLSPVTS